MQNENVIVRSDESSIDNRVHVERTDNQLVDLVLAGDELAFEQLFDRHKRLVAVVASRYFRRADEIEEIIQITFSKAFPELGTFRGNYDRSLSSWLVRITTNACLDMIRSTRRKPERLNCDLSETEIETLFDRAATDTYSAEQELLDRDLAEKLMQCLPDADRALLQMLYAEERSVADIADAFGCSRTNVKVRAWRARAAMRKLLRKLL